MSDVLGTVVAIQGNDVKEETLGADQDGYVLTWDNGEEEWSAKPVVSSSGGLRKEYFTSSGTWTCPEGVTGVFIVASGGGAGGAGTGAGGAGAVQTSNYISVTPNTTYSIVIGAGGAGGIGGSYGRADEYHSVYIVTTPVSPTNGGFTSFSDGSTLLFKTVGGGEDGPQSSYVNCYSAGSAGTTVSGSVDSSMLGTGGQGGKAGPRGNGGNGGNGLVQNGGTGYNGSNAAANTGAGGGGGGACGVTSFTWTSTYGNGGNGGSGYLYLIY